MHFHTAAYCILNQFNLSPSLETSRLQELKVLPSPFAYICLLSCFCSSKTLDAGQRNAELHRPRSRVAGDLWPSQGPAMLWGTSLGSQAQHGQTQSRGICAPCARAAPAPAPLALWLSILDAGAAEQGEQLLSHGVRRSLQPHSVQLSQGEATAPGLAGTILPLGTAFPATPAARSPSDHHFPTVACGTCEAGMAPQGLWSHC